MKILTRIFLLSACISISTNLSAQSNNTISKNDGKFILFDTALKLKPVVNDSVYIKMAGSLFNYNDAVNEKIETYENLCLISLLRPLTMGGYPYRAWLLFEKDFKPAAAKYFFDKWQTSSGWKKDFYGFCTISPALMLGNLDFPLEMLDNIKDKDLNDKSRMMIYYVVTSANVPPDSLTVSMNDFLKSNKKKYDSLIKQITLLKDDPKN